MDYETRTHHSNMDVYDRIQQADMEQMAVIEASFVYHGGHAARQTAAQGPARAPAGRPAGGTRTGTDGARRSAQDAYTYSIPLSLRDSFAENLWRSEQAQHQVRFGFEIVEEAGLHQHVMRGQQFQSPFFFAANARRLHGGVPSPFHRQDSGGRAGQRVPRAHARLAAVRSRICRATSSPALSNCAAAHWTGVPTER